MEQNITRETVLQELNLIPEANLFDLYQLLHRFRLRTEANRGNTIVINQFAGCWNEMPASTFDDFLTDVTERRTNAFLRRRTVEAETD